MPLFARRPMKAYQGHSPIIFTNRGARNCYLDASPVVQATDGRRELRSDRPPKRTPPIDLITWS